jgi:hypothetical protein
MVDIGNTDKISEKYLQLFMEDKFTNATLVKGRKSRWGDQSLIASDVRVSVSSQELTIRLKALARKDFKQPIVGFRIRDVSGVEITGTNTRLENNKLQDLIKGQEVSVTWTMPNVLRDGKYTVDTALQYPDEITVADWWNNAASFEVKKTRHLPYVVDPLIKTKIS